MQPAELAGAPCTDQACITVALVNAAEATRTWGTELLARYRRGAFTAMITHGWTRSTELDVDEGLRRDVPLTPRHAMSLNAMWEGEAWGRLGIEAYYTGRQSLEDNPYRSDEPRATCCSAGSSSDASDGSACSSTSRTWPTSARRPTTRSIRPTPPARRPLDGRRVGAARRPGLQRRRPPRVLAASRVVRADNARMPAPPLRACPVAT